MEKLKIKKDHMEQFATYFTPRNYQLSLELDKHQKTRKGTVRIEGHSLTDFVKLHCVGTEVDYITIDGSKADFSLANCVLTVSAGPESDFTLEIGFHGPLNENMQGAYLSTYQHDGATETIISTQFESHYARECFPCIDEPGAKATFDLTISVPDTDDTILANTPVKNIVKDTTKKSQTVTFETTPRMSTYLLAFVIGKFQSSSVTSAHGVKITTYIPQNQSVSTLDFANHIAAASLDYYDDLFGVPYPLPKLDQVAIPDFEAGAMENWGLVTFRESCLLADDTVPLDTKKSVAVTISHELSHMWFGDLVTMQWWDDLWLNESFASVMEYYAVDHIHPEYHIWEDFFTGSCLSAFFRDALPGVQAVQQDVHHPSEIATLFDGAIVYAKGAHLMFMLIRLIGFEPFMKGVHDYFEQHKYNNTVGDDLWSALQPYANFDVKKFMHAWISQPGYPVVTDGSTQRFLLTGDSDSTEWPLPEITDDMSGHYLINLSGPEFSCALDNFPSLSLEQRLRLLIDRMLLAKTPLVSSASLVELLPKFSHESSAAVWDILLTIIGNLKIFFTPDSAEEKAYKNYLVDVITPNLTRLGFTPKAGESDDDTRLRSSILSVALYIEQPAVIEALSSLYSDDIVSIHPEIRSYVLFAKLRSEEAEFFDIFLEKYQKTSDPEQKFSLLSALTSARLPENISKLLSLLSQPDIVKPQDHIYLFAYLRRNHLAKSQAFNWLRDNWDYVCEMTGEKSIEDYPRLAASGVRTPEEAASYYAFFDQKKSNPVLKRTISVAHADIDSRLRLISSDGKAVLSALK